MRHESDRFSTMRARMTAMFLASERRGEELVARLGDRVTDSLARLHNTTAWLASVWGAWWSADLRPDDVPAARGSAQRDDLR